MAQYIDKDILIAEIDRRIKNNILLQQRPEMSDLQEELQAKIDNLKSIRGYILNTLEVKEVQEEHVSEELEEAAKKYGTKKHPMTKTGANESAYDFKAGAQWQKERLSTEVKQVDLDSNIRTYLTNNFNIYEDGVLQSKKSGLLLNTYDIIKTTKHFFELGLNAQKE